MQVVFDTFAELGSMSAVMRYLTEHDLKIGVRDHRGPDKGQLQYVPQSMVHAAVSGSQCAAAA